MNLFDQFHEALAYNNFLALYASDVHLQRWRAFHAQVQLTQTQRDLIASFTRTMNVLCLAGAWCGDCINQCPIFDHFAAGSPTIQLRFLDRDVNPDVRQALQINGGDRVPVVVFFSEDGYEVARYGE